MTDDLHVVVLAAGKGTRMRSSLPKVLHKAAGLPLIEWVIRAARAMRPQTITVVLGHGSDQVRECFADAEDVRFVIQEPQLGTGHALLQTERVLAGRHGAVLLLSGDAPLVTRASLERLVAVRRERGAALVVATADLADPSGYGRVVRHEGELLRIVEDRDAVPAERAITEINSGIYAFSLASLFDALARLGTRNAQGEYYLPELVDIHRQAGRVVIAGASQRRRRNPRHQHPRGAGSGRAPAAAAHQRGADDVGRHPGRSRRPPTSARTSPSATTRWCSRGSSSRAGR